MVIKVCINCSKETKHYAKGLCKTCYNKTKINLEKQKTYVINWKIKNPDYFKQYYIKHKPINNATNI